MQRWLLTKALGLKLKDKENLSYEAYQETLVLHSTNFRSLYFIRFHGRLKNCMKELKKTLRKFNMVCLTADSAGGAVTSSTETVIS